VTVGLVLSATCAHHRRSNAVLPHPAGPTSTRGGAEASGFALRSAQVSKETYYTSKRDLVSLAYLGSSPGSSDLAPAQTEQVSKETYYTGKRDLLCADF
jgi:hypothetical protein